MCSQTFYKIDVLENSAKFIGKRLYQTLLTPTQMFLREFFEILRNTVVTEHLQTAVSDLNSIVLLY